MNDEQKEVNKIEELIKETKTENSMIALILIASLCSENKDLINELKKNSENIYTNNLFVPNELKVLGNEKYEKYNKEVNEYTQNFISINNCNKYIPHTEFKEYYDGLNNIRIKYGLGKLIQTECKCGGYGYMIDENDLKESEDNEKED